MGGEEVTQTGKADQTDPPRTVYTESFHIIPLEPHHATDAARLHIQGQPGTFLSNLGEDVLQIIYKSIPQQDAGFGFAAVSGPEDSSHELAETNSIEGFVSATTSSGKLFLKTGLAEAGELLPCLMKRYWTQPSLVSMSLQTLLYPLIVRDKQATVQTQRATYRSAELLSIMVDAQKRRHGIGALLLDALINECRRRGVNHLDVTVDAANDGAKRFYVRHGFSERKAFSLYGRHMVSYARALK